MKPYYDINKINPNKLYKIKIKERKRTMTDYDYIFTFKAKTATTYITDQDKKHFRIIATLALAKNGQIERLLDSKFVEKFTFDKQKKVATYAIRILKERKVKYAES